MLKILIVEDDHLYALKIQMILADIKDVDSIITDNAHDAIKLIKKRAPDILLLDLYLSSEMNGIDILKKINRLKIPCIIITAYKDQELYDEAKQFHPFIYLVKPIDPITLQTCINTIIVEKKKSESLTEEYIFVKDHKNSVKLHFAEIEWVKSEGNYCIVKTALGRYIQKISLKKIFELLPKEKFIRVHRKFIVQAILIEGVQLKEKLITLPEEDIPLGNKYKSELLEYLDYKP